MKKLLLLAVVAAIAAFGVWVAGCNGATSACQDLYYKLCECESDKKAQDDCKAGVDSATFTEDENKACSEKNTSCTCATLKNPEQAKTSCPENSEIAS